MNQIVLNILHILLWLGVQNGKGTNLDMVSYVATQMNSKFQFLCLDK